MGAHYIYRRPIKPHRSTRVYENRAESGYVNRNDAFTTRRLELRESEGWHRKNSRVTAHVSQRKTLLMGVKRESLPSIRFSVVASPAGNFFSFFFIRTLPLKRSADSFNWTPNTGIRGACFLHSVHILWIAFYEPFTPIDISLRTNLLTRQFFRTWLFSIYSSNLDAI